MKTYDGRREIAARSTAGAAVAIWSPRGRNMRNGTHRPNGAEVRRLRVRHGWNQEDLASKVGVGKRTIERIEGGYPTTIKVLKFVSEALNVEVESILMVSAVP